MELRQYLKIARRWWWLIVIPTLVVGLLGLATFRAPTPAYSTALRYTAGQPPVAASSPNYDPNYYRWLTSEYIVTALKDWVRSGNFAEALSAELASKGAPIPAGAILGTIAADNARSVLVVYLTWPNADELSAMAEAVTVVLQQQNGRIFPQLGGQPAVIVSLDSPRIGPVPPPLRSRLDMPLKVGLGLLAGLGLALAAHYFDPFLRDRQELEQLGFTVAAEIPRYMVK